MLCKRMSGRCSASTNYTANGMQVEEWNRLHPEQPPCKNLGSKEALQGHDGPVVISTDYVRAYAEQIRRLIDRAR